MKKLMTLALACFGKPQDFMETRKGAEAAFWQQAKGSAWKAARQCPGGRGWWYLTKWFLLREVVPAVLIFGVAVTLLMAGFGGWVATKESRDAEAQSEARRQAFERLEQRVEKAKQQGASHGQQK